MAHHHSSVNYVEPNITSAGFYKETSADNAMSWKVKDDYDRAPRLEDYSIYFNLEVEICSRENISANRTITSDVLILSYHTKPSESASTVNFMGGTKVKCSDANNSSMQYLTTNYADMYVGDLIDYGTTEMIGVKSVDIEYQGSCVPIVTVKFTDVRGISLFQPTELSRTNSYQGINGINSDNVAQSFFQCFFRVPMPRFTMTIKGFYGKPVTYECMCDKFDTKFNSKTGDFDITTRFIGYSYSFLTDVSIDALLAAPYSDYGGRNGNYNEYWDEQVNSGRFTIWNKEKTVKMKMPTLFEIYQQMKHLLTDPIETETSLTEEERTHEEEIQELQEIKNIYQRWYTTLFNVCTTRYGKDYCYLFKKPGKNGDYYRILILTKYSNAETLERDYEQYPDEFKLINKDLYAAIEKYNSKEGNFKKLKNVSLDFGDYSSLFLFNNTYLGTKGQVVFNGFHKFNRLPETQVVNNVFYGVDYSTNASSGTTAQEIKDKESKHKKHVLETIYSDGTDQYTRCYAIDQDYSSITDRIKALQADANRSVREKNKDKRLKALNKEMLSRMFWYPTVENFTKIMMAHMETLMHLMYSVATNCEGRTAEELGVTTGPNGECIDVNAAKNVIPPFPRVTRNVLGDDGITKVEDTWVGEYNRGTKPFEEVDFIDGFFNAIEKMQALKKDMDTMLAEAAKPDSTKSDTYGGVIKHPLSSFDFYITKSPYGDSNEIANDLECYQFAGKVAIRMFDILEISHFRMQYPRKLINDDMVKKIARVEADNFHDNVKLTNEKFLSMLRDGVITAKSLMAKVTSVNDAKKCPWGAMKLFSSSGSNMWLSGYKVENNGVENYLYPIQDISFSKLKETHRLFAQGNIINDAGNISIYTLPKGVDEKKLLTDSAFGNVLITDKIDLASNALNSANSNCDSGYTDYYNILCSAATFDDSAYSAWVAVNGKPSICKSVNGFEGKTISGFVPMDDGVSAVTSDNITGKYDANNISFLGNETKNGNTNGYTITEVFGITRMGEHDYESSFKNSYFNVVNNVRYGKLSLKAQDLRTAIALLSIKTNSTSFYDEFIKTRKTFVYLPKIALLQLGAVCFGTGNASNAFTFRDKTLFYDAIKANLHVDKSFISKGIVQVAISLSKQARYQYAKYFYDWAISSDMGKNLVKNLADDKNYIKPSRETKRALLNQNSGFTKKLTNELLTPMLVINLSLNCKKDVSSLDLPLTQGRVEIYLDAFIERLKELYRINYTEDSNGNLIKTTDEPHQTTDDMKAELYRYMKQLYDKWVPMSSFDDWQMEKYFLESGEEKGHKFYFIDSYYNNIGDKLLINPKNLMERIDGLLSSADVNAMMLGFMADIYAFNRCMMKCIQNFSDLTRRGSMDEMFLPMSFNSINWADVNKYSSFVVVYPYEPSKNLNIPNNEYNDDGFMLNDENDTPKAIRSKSDVEGHYKIPAFGVAYGKQYQSYFKSVNINMQSPIATQQSIQAKHYILQQNTNVKSRGITSQDLYDIYSTQSYTCDVEMMGCAWVQPLMYFVLLNVPMFRGSYLIMKVKHSIKPGDMTTTFTGCRMANMSNKLVEDMFTDDDFLANGEYNEEMASDKSMKADVDNDCPYKIFPLYGTNGSGADLSSELDRKVQRSDCHLDYEYNLLKNDTVLKALARIVANEGGQSSQRLELQEMLVATTMYNRRVHDGNYRNAVFRHMQYDIVKAANTTPKDWVVDLVRNIFTQSPSWILTKYDTTTVTNKNLKARVNSANFKKGQKIGPSKFTLDDLRKIKYFGNYQEYASGKNKFVLDKPIVMAEDSKEDGELGHCFNCDEGEPYMWEIQKKPDEKTEKEDINKALFIAINKSALATPSIGIELESGMTGGYYTITQKNKKSDKLGIVFDMILNSEYYDKVQKLYWVYPPNGLQTDPVHIDYIAAESPNLPTKVTKVAQSGAIGITQNNEIPADASEKLLRSLAKRLKTVGIVSNFKKEVPQVRDTKILDKYKPKDCDSLFSSDGSGGNNANPSEISPNDTGTIDGWNVGKACAWIISHDQGCRKVDGKTKCGIKKCAYYVELAIAAGGGPLKNQMACGDSPRNGGVATNLRYAGILEKNGFVQIDSGTVSAYGNPSISLQAGDVAIIGKKMEGVYHACMYTSSRGWCSDFIQKNMNIYGSSQPYAIYRFHNKKKS